MTADIQENTAMEMDGLPGNTIDPSILRSRIIQSESIQREDREDEKGDEEEMEVDQNNTGSIEQPIFKKLSAQAARGGKAEYRRIRCPAHRYTPLRENWEQLLTPLVEYLKLQVCIDDCFYFFFCLSFVVEL